MDAIAPLLHLGGFPAGMMGLQIAGLGVALGQKTAGGEKHHPLPGDPLHGGHHFQPLLLGQMLNHIQGNAGVKLSGLEMLPDLADVALHILIVVFWLLAISRDGR